ncbi:hypothetical protein MPSEU_000833900 [Mayamaea pseudoterrestris]|nr:hypothetical protein MPSEU_000833900 [Mayamaea pseudoterrestris]
MARHPKLPWQLLLVFTEKIESFTVNSKAAGNYRNTRCFSAGASASSAASAPPHDHLQESTRIVKGRIPFGGDYCGLLATFTVNGSLIPLPENWIPKELFEWGQVPSALEVLVSEESAATSGDDATKDTFTRLVTTILPATGCAVDNQEVVKSSEQFKIVSRLETDKMRALILEDANADTTIKSGRHLLEVSFALVDDEHRVRITIPISTLIHMETRKETGDGSTNESAQSPLPPQLIDPISICLERQVSKTSTHGTIANGGGLDGQKVARVRGPWLSSQMEFASQPMANDKDNDEHKYNSIRLPLNITIASLVASNGCLDVRVQHSSGAGVRAVVAAMDAGPFYELSSLLT